MRRELRANLTMSNHPMHAAVAPPAANAAMPPGSRCADRESAPRASATRVKSTVTITARTIPPGRTRNLTFETAVRRGLAFMAGPFAIRAFLSVPEECVGLDHAFATAVCPHCTVALILDG